MTRLLCVVALGAAAVFAQTRPLRYVNPLSIEDSRSIADPTVLRFEGKYYLFLSGGALWVSDDLVHWTHQAIRLPDRPGVAAPNVFAYRGKIYLSGNDVGLYRADKPTGPWEYAGDIVDENGKKVLLFDSMGFVDDDGKPYMYYSGRHADGIWGVALNPNDITHFAGPAKRLFTFEPSHKWERYGDNNEGGSVSWLEAPWVTKRKGVYYLQYSSPGTEWKTYSVAVYTSKSPLGPFRVAPRNPILVHNRGLINGTGHHCVVEGPDGNLWAVYTILYGNHNVFDRRIGLDRVGFDKSGNMFVDGPSEEPRVGPAVRGALAGGGSGSIAVSLNRYTWSASSMSPGRDPTYAFDNNVRTWWEPAASDKEPWLMLDLGCRNSNDPNQEFVIDSARVLFDTAPAPRTSLVVDGHDRSAPGWRRVAPQAYGYKLEASSDAKSWTVVVDKTMNRAANNVEFDEFAPVRARYVRLTLTNRPADVSTAILEFTVFGK